MQQLAVKIWLSDNLRVSKTYIRLISFFLEVRGVLEHPEHPAGNATALLIIYNDSVHAVLVSQHTGKVLISACISACQGSSVTCCPALLARFYKLKLEYLYETHYMVCCPMRIQDCGLYGVLQRQH